MSRSLCWIARSLSASLVLASLAGAQATTTLVTQGTDGQSNNVALYPEFSEDGRWLTYQSGASNVVPADNNGSPDIFYYDTLTGDTTRVSVTTGGVEGNGNSHDPAISLDGNVVGYFSYATNLVPGDSNGVADVFVRDVQAGTTIRVSVSSTGVQGNATSRYVALNGDGCFVAFESAADNLVPGDTNNGRDVFLRDTLNGTTVLVSSSATGVIGDGESIDASISADGRFIAFESYATNLVPNDTNGTADVFLKDMQTGAIERVSVSSGSVEGNGPSLSPSISADASRIVFETEASNLVPMDANGYQDICLRDRLAGTTERVSISFSGGQVHLGGYDPVISADGGFVVFTSASSHLVLGDTNGADDIFLRDLTAGLTERISVGLQGQGDGECTYPAVSSGGRYVAFDSSSANLVTGDLNGERDIFLRDRLGPFEVYCAGDGSGATACPCSNPGGAGHGCANSVGPGARLEASGTSSVALDDLRFTAYQLAAGQPALMFVGTTQVATGDGVAFGDGLRCAGGSILRLGITVPDGAGNAFWGSGGGLSSSASFAPGEARNFQVWYRDPAGPCSAGFNLSNAVRAVFVP